MNLIVSDQKEDLRVCLVQIQAWSYRSKLKATGAIKQTHDKTIEWPRHLRRNIVKQRLQSETQNLAMLAKFSTKRVSEI